MLQSVSGPDLGQSFPFAVRSTPTRTLCPSPRLATAPVCAPSLHSPHVVYAHLPRHPTTPILYEVPRFVTTDNVFLKPVPSRKNDPDNDTVVHLAGTIFTISVSTRYGYDQHFLTREYSGPAKKMHSLYYSALNHKFSNASTRALLRGGLVTPAYGRMQLKHVVKGAG